MKFKSICVFCGSNTGNNPAYTEAGISLGRLLAESETRLVFGGGKVGMMGIVADAVLKNGGTVLGVIPEFLSLKEVEHVGVSEMIRVKNMHERKMIMYDQSDAFIILPGGTGTMDEFFEILTWSQLGLHTKAIGILNLSGYYDPMIAQLDKMVEHKFLHPINRELVVSDPSITGLIQKMIEYVAPHKEKWLDRSKT